MQRLSSSVFQRSPITIVVGYTTALMLKILWHIFGIQWVDLAKCQNKYKRRRDINDFFVIFEGWYLVQCGMKNLDHRMSPVLLLFSLKLKPWWMAFCSSNFICRFNRWEHNLNKSKLSMKWRLKVSPSIEGYNYHIFIINDEMIW